nr:MAG TPA: hypothetical protein [Bacteriophage sp.]
MLSMLYLILLRFPIFSFRQPSYVYFLFPSKEIIFSLYSLIFTLPFIRA